MFLFPQRVAHTDDAALAFDEVLHPRTRHEGERLEGGALFDEHAEHRRL